MQNTISEERNQYQIARKDARGCFVESLNDSFEIGKIHLVFASYDIQRPVGQRQTNNINIYISVDEFLNLCRKVESGELKYILQSKFIEGDTEPLYKCLGGTSAEKLARIGHPRPDGKSLSRIVQLVCSSKHENSFLFSASSGPGETNVTGLIVPKFGNKPENHVAVNMSYDTFSEFMLLTKAHYQAWLAAWYVDAIKKKGSKNTVSTKIPENDTSTTPFVEMF